VAASRSFFKQSREALLRSILGEGGYAPTGSGRKDEEHPRLALLSEQRLPVAVRLALLGGRLLLFSTGGVAALDPTAPTAGIALRGFETIHVKERFVPSLNLVAPNP